MNPYKYDEPIHVAFSGGRSSGFMLWNILQAGLPEGSQVIFCNTGKEMEQTLEFVRDCSVNWNVPIVWLEYVTDMSRFKIVDFETASRNGEPFESLIRKRNYLPNAVTRFCTAEMKIKTAGYYCKTIGIPNGETESILGFRADEPRRVAKLEDKSRAPMYLAGHTKADVQLFWSTQKLNLNLPSFGGHTIGGNCDLCFLKGANHIYTLIAEKPERAIWWANMEKEIGARFCKDRPTYQEMLNNIADQKDWIGYEEESISCFCGD